MDKRFIGILVAIAVIFIGVFAITQNSNSSGSNSSSNSQVKPTNHVKGNNAKNITFVEYGDYQCPICESYDAAVDKGVEPHLNEIHFQFRNLPLSAIHQNAFAAARAAEAANQQNKFWEMHNKLYEPANWQVWTASSSAIDEFTKYSKDLGLDVNKFKQDYASSYVNDVINADVKEFEKTGQDKATPTFFINGKYVPNSTFVDPQTGAPSSDKISEYLQTQIANAK